MRASWWLAKHCSNIKRCSSNKTFLAALFGQGFTGGAIENIVRISACLFCQNGGYSIVCQANFARQVASVCSKMFWYNMLPFLWSMGNTTITLCLLIHGNAIPSETFLFSSVAFQCFSGQRKAHMRRCCLPLLHFFQSSRCFWLILPPNTSRFTCEKCCAFRSLCHGFCSHFLCHFLYLHLNYHLFKI